MAKAENKPVDEINQKLDDNDEEIDDINNEIYDIFIHVDALNSNFDYSKDFALLFWPRYLKKIKFFTVFVCQNLLKNSVGKSFLSKMQIF